MYLQGGGEEISATDEALWCTRVRTRFGWSLLLHPVRDEEKVCVRACPCKSEQGGPGVIRSLADSEWNVEQYVCSTLSEFSL